MNRKLKRLIINIVLVIVAIFFGVVLVKSIGAPINFKTEKDKREAQIIQRLKDIRAAELLYKQEHNKYTASFDTLIDFCSNYEIPIVKITVHEEDTAYFIANNDYRTTSDTVDYILVKDSLFKKRENFDINHLNIVPVKDTLIYFEIESGFVKHGGISVPVFEVRTPYEAYLAKKGEKFSKDEWETRVRNLKAEAEQLKQIDSKKYAGLKVGSLDEASTDGNWEKDILQ